MRVRISPKILGNRDEDGCPDERLVTVLFEVVDAGGRLVAGAQLDLVSGDSFGVAGSTEPFVVRWNPAAMCSM